MIKTVIMGTGRMGSLIRTTAEGVVDAAGQPVFDIVAQIGFDLSKLENAPAADVIIDFSNVVTFDAVVAYVERTGAALVSGTTGYTPDQMDRLRELGLLRGEDAIAAAQAMLTTRIKGCAKDIRDKYIDPPNTTDFGIMFLPFEGLYAEVVRLGLVEVLQRQYKVNIAGPTTFAALLNSLQMGFRTLAVQKRSSEVWKILSGVKKEFENFESVLTKTKNHLQQVDSDLEALVGVRTRAINKQLMSVGEDNAEQIEN